MSTWCKWVIFVFSLGNVVLADPIRFDVVNKIMLDIAHEATKFDDVVDYAVPKFDESYSDLRKGRLRYTLRGDLKNTPWKPGYRSQVFAASILRVVNNPKPLGISAHSIAQIQTDTLALMRSAAREALKRPLAPPPKFKVRIMDTLVQLSEVQDLTQLYQILVAAKQLSLEIEQHQMQRDHYRGARRQGYMKSIDQLRILPFPNKNRVAYITIISGNLSRLFLSGGFSVIPQFSYVVIAEKTMSFSVKGFAPMQRERIDGLRKELATALAGIQQNHKEESERQLGIYKRALHLFKQTIREK